MADKLTPEQRHKCMSSIRSRNTKPEVLVRKYLFARGFRFRINVRRLPGTPDIVLRKYRTVIFVNGCFWHGHEGCRYFVLPKNRELTLQGLALTLNHIFLQNCSVSKAKPYGEQEEGDGMSMAAEEKSEY